MPRSPRMGESGALGNRHRYFARQENSSANQISSSSAPSALSGLVAKMGRSAGFPPIVGAGAKVLVLGSLPSQKSIEAFEYYAHPQNAFWRIMGELFGAGPEVSYEARTESLKSNRIAVWDVLSSSVRPGSMDSDIDVTTAEPNDFSIFFETNADIRLVCFNGQKAARMFEDLVLDRHPELQSGLTLETLPSTSPAYASMSFEEKLAKWSIVSRRE